MRDAVGETTTDGAESAVALDPIERRVLGVLIEKQLSTPASYPLTLNALIAGCNQKSNRDPVLDLEPYEVQEALERLRARGLVSQYFSAGGRAEKWRTLDREHWGIGGPERAVLAELLLRGPQSMGELRARASRMVPIADLAALGEVLEALASHQPPLAVRLSPPGQRRGVRWAHALYPETERAALRTEEGARAAAAGGGGGGAGARSGVREQLAALERRIARIEQHLGLEPLEP
ncbi:MAG: DUF480 domain-containing protein [Planctomycetota bacterium]|nr:MAG: DUF480 domain-containing protein [Planctomycetota bacterium]